MKPTVAIILLTAALAGSASSEPPPEEPRIAPIRMNTEASYPALPEVVRDRLKTNHCRIPQPWPYDSPSNIVSGHFIARTRTDFAALCSRNGISSVVVINGSNGAVIAILNPVEDKHFPQDEGGSVYEFSRRLERLAPPDTGFCLSLDDPYPCEGSDLDGILDEFQGKASETHCYRRAWHTVTSGD